MVFLWFSYGFLVPKVPTGAEESRRGTAPVSQLEDLMRRRGVDAAWDALEDAKGMLFLLDLLAIFFKNNTHTHIHTHIYI